MRGELGGLAIGWLILQGCELEATWREIDERLKVPFLDYFRSLFRGDTA